MGDEESVPESRREVAAEDFLFHLYRGSELLQDDRVHEAKQELENALALQPRDAKGQDLLAIVYFRLGLYPRAIAIYTELIAAFPDANTPRINVALCYLKTGQPGAARAELERVIQRDPGHTRAWGYLGLAFQRMGDLERAIAAFQAGGQDAMARRLAEMSPSAAATKAAAAPGRSLTTPEREALSRAATEAFDEIDRGEGPFRAESSQTRSVSAGTWASVEPGRESVPSAERRSFPSFVPSLAPSDSLPPPAFGLSRQPSSDASGDDERQVLRPAEGAPPSARADRGCSPPSSTHVFAREHLLVFPRDYAVSLHESGCVLIRGGVGVAARFDAVRAVSSATTIATKALPKRNRGRDADEPLGIAGAPLLALDRAGELVLGPPAGTKLFPIALTEDPLTVRESALIALEGDVVYDNAKLPNGEGDFVSIVHLRGSGTATLALPAQFASIEVPEGRTLLLRVHSVLGWLGRVTARTLAPSESPTRARGLVEVQGEGMVILDGR